MLPNLFAVCPPTAVLVTAATLAFGRRLDHESGEGRQLHGCQWVREDSLRKDLNLGLSDPEQRTTRGHQSNAQPTKEGK